MLGDAAYDGGELREQLDERGTKPVIPNRSNRKQPFIFNKRLYKLRWRIETAFNRLKDFRRIATRLSMTEVPAFAGRVPTSNPWVCRRICYVSAPLSDRLLLALRASGKFVVRIARSIPQISQCIHGPTGGRNTARSSCRRLRRSLTFVIATTIVASRWRLCVIQR